MLELYHARLTTCSTKARLCLAEKGLDDVSHYLNLPAFEHHRPEYLALNPNGAVPTLVHDGRVIIDSTFSNEHLDAASALNCEMDMRYWIERTGDVCR